MDSRTDGATGPAIVLVAIVLAAAAIDGAVRRTISPALAMAGGIALFVCASAVIVATIRWIRPPASAVIPEMISVLPKLNSLTGKPNPIMTAPATTAMAPTTNNTADIRVTVLCFG